MNAKITISVLASFVIGFSIFVFVMLLPNILHEKITTEDVDYINMQEEFFSKKFNPNEKKIFIIGSSYIMALNSTYINNYLSKFDQNYHVYNLAILGDHIKKRSEIIDKMISANPTIIIYGIAEEDFSEPVPVNVLSTKDMKLLPDPHNIIKEWFSEAQQQIGYKIELPQSPKAVTWKIIRDINKKESDDIRFSPYPDAPFLKILRANTVTVSDLELKNLVSYIAPLGKIESPEKNESLSTFKQIIAKLQDNNIKTIIFVVPHHKYLLDTEQKEFKESFSPIIQNIRQTGITVYFRNDAYSDLHIWHDLTHVAVNEGSLVFSEEVAKMIVSEIEK